MGERRTFRICMKWLVKSQFDMAANLIGLIPEYGRFDDWFCLLDTGAAGIVLSQIKNQLEKDICNMKAKKEVSLLAKWLPSCNTSSAKSRENAGIICRALGMTRRKYRRMLVELRAYLKVVEVNMAAGNWENIDYSKVPSRANLVYGRAFLRNDEERRRDFLSKLTRGEVKINADTLFPSDIVAKYQREHGTANGRTLFEEIGEEFRKKGYKLPRLIFWNVCTRTEAIPLRENDGGVALVSGFSPAVYNMVLSDELDPYKCLLAQINSKRYEPVEKALA